MTTEGIPSKNSQGFILIKGDFMKKITLTLLFCFLIGLISPILANGPVSKEATILDVASSSELFIEGVGVFYSEEKRKRKRKKEVKRYGVDYAVLDAKKAAIYYVLFNSTDPYISRPDEIERFENIQDEFFSQENIEEVIVYSEPKPHKIVSLANGEGVKVFLNMKVNIKYLRQVLEENLVIFSREELVEHLGYPQIIVIPVAEKGESPLKGLKEDPKKQHAAGVIESYLTSKEFEVIVPDQLEAINQMTESISKVNEIGKDPTYELALKIGSDIYLQYSIGQTKSAYDTDQIAVTLKAYETTTARLLATETGYSKPRVGEEYVSIEEALLSALTTVSQRLLKYWEKDLYKGIQYKVITQLDPRAISDEKYEDIVEDMLDAFESVSQIMKENVTTKQTFDVTLWCNHEEVSSARDLYKSIKKEFSKKQKEFEIKLTNKNRKLLLLNIR